MRQDLLVREVAEQLKCSKPTVHSMLREGRLDGYRLRRVWRVIPESLALLRRGGVGTFGRDGKTEGK